MSELSVTWSSSDVVWMDRSKGRVLKRGEYLDVSGFVELAVDGDRYEFPRGMLDWAEGDRVVVERVTCGDGSLWLKVSRIKPDLPKLGEIPPPPLS